jgi:hypothetical protein
LQNSKSNFKNNNLGNEEYTININNNNDLEKDIEVKENENNEYEMLYNNKGKKYSKSSILIKLFKCLMIM